MIKICICDNNMTQLNMIEAKCKKIFLEINEPISIIKYNRSNVLLSDIKEGINYDIFLLDILMEHTSGLELASYIKEIFPFSLTIFITDNDRYAIESFKLNIFRYIMKANLDLCLPEALHTAINMIELNLKYCLIVHNKNLLTRIPYKNIIAIHKLSLNKHIEIIENVKESFTKTTTLRTYTMKMIKNELCTKVDYFISIDQSTIVNMLHMKSITGNIAYLSCDLSFDISRPKLTPAKNNLIKFWSDSL